VEDPTTQPVPTTGPPTGSERFAAMPVPVGAAMTVPHALIWSGLGSLGISAAGLVIVARRRRQW
jgi:hypothetical protein